MLPREEALNLRQEFGKSEAVRMLQWCRDRWKISLDRAMGMSFSVIPLLGFPGVVKAPGEDRSTGATGSLCYRILPALCSGRRLPPPYTHSVASGENQPRIRNSWEQEGSDVGAAVRILDLFCKGNCSHRSVFSRVDREEEVGKHSIMLIIFF